MCGCCKKYETLQPNENVINFCNETAISSDGYTLIAINTENPISSYSIANLLKFLMTSIGIS